jgi:hypothetical protein
MNIEVLVGEIEALGTSEFNRVRRFYSQIRMLEQNGNVRTLKNVLVFNQVDSYLTTGINCKLFLVKSVSGVYIAFAISTNSRIVYDRESLEGMQKDYQKIKKLNIFMAICSIPLFIAIIGFILLLIAILKLYENNQTRKLTATLEEMDLCMINNGFQIN